ncbi:transcriptional regulator [Streptococcus mutans]|nr:transcriptional regulator [Streptococcus mutans]
MRKQMLGMIISSLRKEKGMTQLELAEKMRVTDKAVSKWERDLSFPDINSIPKLAEIFEVSVDDLMQVKTNTKETIGKNKITEIIDTALKGIGTAMGIAVVVLSVLGRLDIKSALMMLGIGAASVSVVLLKGKKEEK